MLGSTRASLLLALHLYAEATRSSEQAWTPITALLKKLGM